MTWTYQGPGATGTAGHQLASDLRRPPAPRHLQPWRRNRSVTARRRSGRRSVPTVIDVRPGRPGWAEVTFRHPCDADNVAVSGEFNQWQARALALAEDADGHRTATVEIPIGRTYRFRYVLDGDRWENDWGADAYVPNEFGGDDSVLDLRHDGPHGDRLGVADSREARAQRADGSLGRNTSM